MFFVIKLTIAPLLYFGTTAILKEVLHESAARIIAMLIVLTLYYSNLPEEIQWNLLLYVTKSTP